MWMYSTACGRTANGIPEVKNLTDYAGLTGKAITDVAIRVTKGSVRYRVHVKGKGWLPYVTGYNLKDAVNGYAGNGQVIDAIEVYYYTPDGIKPVKKAKYRVAPCGRGYYPWQYDNETKKGQDGYAGLFRGRYLTDSRSLSSRKRTASAGCLRAAIRSWDSYLYRR